MTGAPLEYLDRCDNYDLQNRARGRWGRLTAPQIRQLNRMDGRDWHRSRGDLTWTPPPAPRGYTPTVVRSTADLRGSFATHQITITPGQKARQGKRTERMTP